MVSLVGYEKKSDSSGMKWRNGDLESVTNDERPEQTERMEREVQYEAESVSNSCLLYTSPSPRDQRGSRMPSSA